MANNKLERLVAVSYNLHGYNQVIVHGCAPSGYGASSIIPKPKKHNINVADSNNGYQVTLLHLDLDLKKNLGCRDRIT